jgi:hypothetical protein
MMLTTNAGFKKCNKKILNTCSQRLHLQEIFNVSAFGEIKKNRPNNPNKIPPTITGVKIFKDLAWSCTTMDDMA